MRKGPRILALDRTSSPKGISPALSNAAAKGYSLYVSERAINQFTQALDHQTATQPLKLAHKFRPETKQGKKQRMVAQAGIKLPAKGMSPPRVYLSWQGLTLSPSCSERTRRLGW